MRKIIAFIALLASPSIAMAQQAVSGIYTTATPTLSDGQQRQLRLDSAGALVTSSAGSGTSSGQVQGTQADSATAVGNPVNVAGRYTSTLPTLTNGQSAQLRQSINGAQLVAQTPTTDANIAIVPVASTAVESNRVFKASAGNLYRLSITSGASAGYLMVFNATTAPADGAVTPLVCRAIAASSTLTISFSDFPARFSTGITAVFSTTGCFTKTASATAYFEGYTQ
ncbi:hypothetical protein [Sphingobium fuliginis]|jgi:hypothetical protein|uniref:hypothetical protein n=1 Tax=Sphingobium fuliginis (strain ATCC 27551) TaxID=336203 RepID=UPI0037C8B06E